jgi:hypothetical protein
MPEVREGFHVFPEIAAFLGGIFFTALLLLSQNKEAFSSKLSIFNVTLPITQYFAICLSVMVTCVFFTFSSILFGYAIIQDKAKMIEKGLEFSLTIFGLGFLSMVISLFAVLLIVHFWIAILGFLLSLGILIKWISLS